MLVIVAALAWAGAGAQLLWRVTCPGQEKAAYLFGTMHLASGSFIDSVAGLPQAIDEADSIVVEIENGKLRSPEALTMLTRAMMAPQDSMLDQLLSPTGLAVVNGVIDKYFAPLGVGHKTFYALKPAAVMTQIGALQALEAMGKVDESNLIDAAVERRMTASGKPVHSLETVQEQVDLLLNYPLRQQAADLLELCKADGEVRQKTLQLVEAYRRQDLEGIVAIMSDPEMGGNEDDMQRMIYDRNRHWVTLLAPMLRRGGVLVAVGAGHLPLEQGLIALLRGQGFSVEPVAAQ